MRIGFLSLSGWAIIPKGLLYSLKAFSNASAPDHDSCRHRSRESTRVPPFNLKKVSVGPSVEPSAFTLHFKKSKFLSIMRRPTTTIQINLDVRRKPRVVKGAPHPCKKKLRRYRAGALREPSLGVARITSRSGRTEPNHWPAPFAEPVQLMSRSTPPGCLSTEPCRHPRRISSCWRRSGRW